MRWRVNVWVCILDLGNNNGIGHEGRHGLSSEEDEILGRSIKKMPQDENMAEAAYEVYTDISKEDVVMGDLGQKEKGARQERTDQWFKHPMKTQISYKAKLTGEAEEKFDRDLDEQVREWIRGEEDMALKLSEEQKKLLETLPHLKMPDERLKERYRPWKDALIITLLGRKTNLNMMRDRVQWLLKSENFELIDLLNNYYVFRSGDKTLCTKLLFEGPWMI